MTSRRRFFTKVITLTVGSIAVAACSKESDNGNEASPGKLSNYDNKSSLEQDRLLLDAFVDTIVPKDQDPGAVEAGVTEELLAWFDEKPEEKTKAIEMLATIDRVANNKFCNTFKKLKLEQRENVLDITIRSVDSKHHPARNSIQRLRSRIIRAFYMSPTGWAMLGYTAPFPGGYPDYSTPPV